MQALNEYNSTNDWLKLIKAKENSGVFEHGTSSVARLVQRVQQDRYPSDTEDELLSLRRPENGILVCQRAQYLCCVPTSS